MIPQSDDDYVSSESDNDESAPVYEMQKKSTLEKELEFQIKKRTLIVEELRKAYLRDVVAIKYMVSELLTDPEKKEVFDEWKETLPSADLKDALLLRSPFHGVLSVAPCAKCGGTINIQFSDIQQVKDLQSKVDSLNGRNELLRLMIATLEAKNEQMLSATSEEVKNHSEEKKYLYGEIRRLKTEMEEQAIRARVVSEMNKKIKEENLKHISNHQDMTIRSLANEKALERALEMNTELRQTVGELRVEVHAYQTGSMDLEAKIAILEERLRAKDGELVKKQGVIDELNHEMSELKTQLDKQREFSKNAENAAELSDRAKESLREENRKLQVVLDKQVAANEVLEDKVESLRMELKDAAADLEASRSVVNTLQFEGSILKNLIAGLEARLQEKEADVAKLLAAMAELENKQKEAQDEIAVLSRDISARERDFAEKEREMEERLAEEHQMANQMAKSVSLQSLVSNDVSEVPLPTRTISERSYGLQAKATPKIAARPAVVKREVKAEEPPPVVDDSLTGAAKKYTPVNKRQTPARSSIVKAHRPMEHVILLDPIDPNSAEEMHMREVILSLVSSATDEPTARKALNAITPFIAERSKILESTLQAVSDTIVSSRSALQAQGEVKVFMSGALDFINSETKMSVQEIDKVLARVQEAATQLASTEVATQDESFPIFPSTELPAAEVPEAEQIPAVPMESSASQEHPEQSLVPLAPITTPPRSRLPYRDVLGTPKFTETDSITSLQNIVRQLEEENAANKKYFHESIVAVTKEWAEASKVVVQLEATIENAKQSIRDELDPVVIEQAGTIKRLNAKLESEIAGRKLVVQKFTEASNEISKLKPRSDRLFEAEDRARFLQREHDEMEIKLLDTQLKLNQLSSTHDALLSHLHMTKAELEEKSNHLDDHKRNVHILRQSITDQAQEVFILSEKLQELMQREYHRINCLTTTETQCYPAVESVAIQTEFIIPAMSLAVDKQRHKFKAPLTRGGQLTINPSTLMGTASEIYLVDKKSIEFDKALESLRLGPNQQLASSGLTLSPFSESLCDRAVSSGSRQTSAATPTKRASLLSRSLPSLDMEKLMKTPNSKESKYRNM